ncbi:TRZ/ATZ family protein [Gracilaria domingensis]|nr:TRZ/ATZ family protein [Gracilaria domingensis]
MKPVDTEIRAKWVLPIAPDENVALYQHSVIVSHGKILDILPSQEADEKYNPTERVERPNSIILPGLINAHTHSGMTVMRGRADDQPLLKWLHETVWPIEQAMACEEEFCEDGALLAAAEMIRGGVTCFSDMYFFPAAGVKAALRAGIRAVIGIVFLQFPSGHNAFQDQPLIHFTYAPHAPYTVSSKTWIRLKDLSNEKGIPIHTHLHETIDECTASRVLDRTNPACHTSEEMCHPIEDFNRKGILDSNFIGAHMVHLTDSEIALCAEKGVHVAHCPTSNAKLASGFCPVHKLIKAGVNVAIGTDSACSNNSLDMLAEVKMAALLAKCVAGDPTLVPAPMALRMATINGARAFGLEEITGSLEIGKSADLICIDVETHAGNSPVYCPHSAVVYAASREDVTDVMVAGNFILREKLHCTLDLDDVLRRADYWKTRIIKDIPLN